MHGRAVWDLRPSRRIIRSVRSLRTACRHAAPQPAPPPQPQPQLQPQQPPPVPRPAPQVPASRPYPAQAQKITDTELVHALWYAVELDSDVKRRVCELLERARKELGYV